MSESVFVIEQGSYSDYRVVGVYTTRKAAETVCTAINANESWEKAEISEWPLDPGAEDICAGRVPHHVLMLKDGTVEKVQRREISSYEIAGSAAIWRRSQAPAYRGKGVPDVLNATVWASDTDHAVKIVNEKRGQMIAMGQWE